MSAKEEQRLQIISEFRAGEISREGAATLCGVHERTITRLARKVRTDGPSGICHGNKGRAPNNKTCPKVEQAAIELIKSKYYDFNIKHAWEMLTKRHGFEMSYDTLWRWCHKHGVRKGRKRRASKARVARERMASRGMMLQMDGSHHEWNGKDKWCLIGAIDDASSEIPACQFFKAEDTFSVLAVLRSVIEIYGIPQSLYVDHGKAFGGMSNEEQNQFRRVCKELGITIINALSPQAKGRIERAWRTFQDRLIPEMRDLGIRTMPAANRYLTETFLPNYWNENNTVEPRSNENFYRSYDKDLDLDQIFCKKYLRKIRRGQLIDFRGCTYRIKSPVIGSIIGKPIHIHEYPNGEWRLFFMGQNVKMIPWEKGRRKRVLLKAS